VLSFKGQINIAREIGTLRFFRFFLPASWSCG